MCVNYVTHNSSRKEEGKPEKNLTGTMNTTFPSSECFERPGSGLTQTGKDEAAADKMC